MKTTTRDIAASALMRFLETNENNVGKDVAESIEKGTHQAEDKTYILRKDIGGAGNGIVQLVDEGEVRRPGVSSFAQGKIENGTVMVVTRIGLKSHGNAAMSGAAFTSVIADQALRNSFLEFKQGSQNWLKDFPVSNFSTSNGSNEIMGDFVELEKPIILVNGSVISANLETAAGETMGANCWTELALSGLSFKI